MGTKTFQIRQRGAEKIELKDYFLSYKNDQFYQVFSLDG